MAVLMYNNDSTNLSAYHRDEGLSLELIDERVDIVARSGVSIFTQCICAQRTRYVSKVWESWWDGFDPDGPNDQEFFNGIPPKSIPVKRAQIEAMLKLERSGIDFVETILGLSRKRGMSPWAAVRMNDHHATTPPVNSIVSSFWRKNPGLRRHPRRLLDRTFPTLDYACPEVREHYRKLFEEVMGRYDVEGVELDFMRGPYCFKIGRESEGSEIMTAWLMEIKQLIQSSAEQKGHSIQVAVKVPTSPVTAMRCGLDVSEWARKGLMDIVITSPGVYGAEIDFDTPTKLWCNLLDPYGIRFLGSILPSEFRYPGARGDGVGGQPTAAPDAAIGAVMAFLYEGADGVELFNYFPEKVLNNGRGWTIDSFINTLKAMKSVESMTPLKRKHIVGGRQLTAPGEQVAHNPLVLLTKNWCQEMGSGVYCLPVEGEQLAFRLQTGPKPAGRQVRVTIGMEAGLLGSSSICHRAPEVLVNDVRCMAHQVNPGDVLFTYDVPEAALADREHVIEVVTNPLVGPTLLRITRVEFLVEVAAKGANE